MPDTTRKWRSAPGSATLACSLLRDAGFLGYVVDQHQSRAQLHLEPRVKDLPIFREEQTPKPRRFPAWPFLAFSVLYMLGMLWAALGESGFPAGSGRAVSAALSYAIIALVGGCLLVAIAIALLIALAASIPQLSTGRIAATVAASLLLALAVALPFAPAAEASMRLDFALNSQEREAVVQHVIASLPAHGSVSGTRLLPSFVPSWRRGLVSAGGMIDVSHTTGGTTEIVFYYVRGFTSVRIVYESDDSAWPADETIAHLAPHWYLISGDTGGI
jgi:hypothetical protein